MRSCEKVVFYDSQLGRFVVEFFRGRAFLHLKLGEKKKEAVRVMLALWPEYRKILRAIGYTKLYAYNREEIIEWPAFMRHLGFIPVLNRKGWLFMESNNA